MDVFGEFPGGKGLERLRKEWINEADGDAGLCTRLLMSQLLSEKRIGFGNLIKALTGQKL